ncbi:centromere protein U-like isoform X2 [Pseudoliparis swirei]|uniref:centromere protein U-like isoform X2 n=1 Tax=Pseudoliparis swirei TaxID=2059687 RepID=UPI0024BDE371|nr:centromere protein U-like isoform X2 [Pseudoliparis swirei]
MSAKKGRRAQMLTKPQQESQKGAFNDMDSPDLSSIDRASFLEGLQQNYGNPLHSTAMEDDLKVPELSRMNGAKAGKKEVPQTAKTSVVQRGAAVKRKETEQDEEEEEEEEEKMKKRSRRMTGGTRPGDNQQTKEGKKRGSETGSGKSSDAAPKKPDAAQKRVLSSDEEEGDEDRSWKPSPKKATALRLGRSRKSSSKGPKTRTSSSGSAPAEPEEASREKQRRSRHDGGRGTESEVVLDAFLEFCDQYRESVESKAVKLAIDSFSSNVKEQLLEKISNSKEFKVLKRDNAKVAASIRTKTQRLLDAKYELMRAERETWLMQKDKAELKVRLADLRRGQAFLQDFRELSRRYLDYRHKHPKEKETMFFGVLLPVLLPSSTGRPACPLCYWRPSIFRPHSTADQKATQKKSGEEQDSEIALHAIPYSKCPQVKGSKTTQSHTEAVLKPNPGNGFTFWVECCGSDFIMYICMQKSSCPSR